MGFYSTFFPQSVYRSPKGKFSERIGSQSLDVTVPVLTAELSESMREDLREKIISLNAVIVMILLPEQLHGKSMSYLNGIYKALGLHKKISESQLSRKRVSTFWKAIESPITNRIKLALLERYGDEIVAHYNERIEKLVRGYMRKLPRHVATAEEGDLLTIAQLEFIETIKAWSPDDRGVIWPLAYSRIQGAMKDHIRYITKSDPTRFFDWVSDAGHALLAYNEDSEFEGKIETGVQLGKAMEALTPRERKVVTFHTQDDMTFKQISALTDVSESQISRIYKRAVEKMRKAVATSL